MLIPSLQHVTAPNSQGINDGLTKSFYQGIDAPPSCTMSGDDYLGCKSLYLPHRFWDNILIGIDKM